MFTYIANVASKDIAIPQPTKIVTQNNLSRTGFKMVADTALNRLVLPLNIENLTLGEVKRLNPEVGRRFDITMKGIKLILQGLEFTAYGDRDGNLGVFTIASVSRPGRIYSPSDFDCQCEGFENHGVCYHSLLRPLFQNYFTILRAHEQFVQAHARIGLELRAESESAVRPMHPRDVNWNELFDGLSRLPIPPPDFRGM